MRKVFEIVNGNKKAIVKHNSEWQEYRVYFYYQYLKDQWILNEEATYHTDDKVDAIETAELSVN